jgi:hypothetical protein
MRYKGTKFYLTTENPEFGTQLVFTRRFMGVQLTVNCHAKARHAGFS